MKQALITTGTGWVDADPEIRRLKPDITSSTKTATRAASASIARDSALNTSCSNARPRPACRNDPAPICGDSNLVMLKTGILNPQINSLLSRVRHTNTLVIADRGFPFWPMIETVDLSLVDDVPTVLQVLKAIRPNFQIGKAWMAQEFLKRNSAKDPCRLCRALRGIELKHELHMEFKKRVPHAIGLIRTGDTTQYANIILESA